LRVDSVVDQRDARLIDAAGGEIIDITLADSDDVVGLRQTVFFHVTFGHRSPDVNDVGNAEALSGKARVFRAPHVMRMDDLGARRSSKSGDPIGIEVAMKAVSKPSPRGLAQYMRLQAGGRQFFLERAFFIERDDDTCARGFQSGREIQNLPLMSVDYTAARKKKHVTHQTTRPAE
jgi:hypothetical protein